MWGRFSKIDWSDDCALAAIPISGHRANYEHSSRGCENLQIFTELSTRPLLGLKTPGVRIYYSKEAWRAGARTGTRGKERSA